MLLSIFVNSIKSWNDASRDIISEYSLSSADLEHLMVTIQNNIVLHTTVGESIVLPCKPTFPQVIINLTKNYEPYVSVT